MRKPSQTFAHLGNSASNLAQVVDAIGHHVKDAGNLPANLAMLAGRPGTRLAVVDPVTGKLYEFEPTGPRSYRLCANFSTDTAATPAPSPYWLREVDWAHGIGRQCFDRTAATSTGLPSD